MRNIKPKPTRYGGVVFRSKSEAMFAAALATFVVDDSQWIEYEPSRLTLDTGYVPDFLCNQGAEGKYLVIEYKPVMPSRDYLVKLVECFDEYSSLSPNVTCRLAIGSVYEHKLECLFFSKSKGRWVKTMLDHRWHAAQLASRSLRFDLFGVDDEMFVRDGAGRKWTFRDKCGKETVRLRAANEKTEPERIERLKETFGLIVDECAITASLIRVLCDDKGCLRVFWEQEPNKKSVEAVRRSWAEMNEYETSHTSWIEF